MLPNKKLAYFTLLFLAGVIIEELLDRGVDHIYVTDCNQKQVEDIRDAFSNKVNYCDFFSNKVHYCGIFSNKVNYFDFFYNKVNYCDFFYNKVNYHDDFSNKVN